MRMHFLLKDDFDNNKSRLNYVILIGLSLQARKPFISANEKKAMHLHIFTSLTQVTFSRGKSRQYNKSHPLDLLSRYRLHTAMHKLQVPKHSSVYIVCKQMYLKNTLKKCT